MKEWEREEGTERRRKVGRAERVWWGWGRGMEKVGREGRMKGAEGRRNGG